MAETIHREHVDGVKIKLKQVTLVDMALATHMA